MSNRDLEYFQQLKQEVASTYKKVYPSCDIPIEEWTSQDITNFQEELLKQVKGQLSEKWFYTHIKSTQNKVPRLDMLNLLSEYAGYKNWRDFTSQFAASDPPKETPAMNTWAQRSKGWKKVFWVSTPLVVLVYFLFFYTPAAKTYQFCFVDADLKHSISSANIEISILKEHESPVVLKCDSNGCFQLTTGEKSVRFAVSAPYHKPDTIIRYFDVRVPDERIMLKSDDYALMIHMFSTSNIDDWRKRRAQLNDMIADEARIFQVNPGSRTGMELYNKKGFINKLTTPIKSLKNIEVLDVQYQGGQISSLRFVQKGINIQ